MKSKKIIYLITSLCVLLLISACGAKPNYEGADNVNTKPPEASQENSSPAPQEESSPSTDEQIVVIIDQTPKPGSGNSFDFSVKKLPEGYLLAQMQWISKENLIVDSLQDAIRHGGTGEEGFYISGNGQFTGFIYRDTMKGETGKVVLLFMNAEGKELTWKKEITLK